MKARVGFVALVALGVGVAWGARAQEAMPDADLARLEDPSPTVRKDALYRVVVAPPRSPRVAAAVAQRLRDGDDQVRAMAAWALDELDARDQLEALRAALERETSRVFAKPVLESAIRSLEASHGERSAVAVVASGSGDRSKLVAGRIELVKSPDAWQKLWAEHSDAQVPAVDFGANIVVAVFKGLQQNASGVELVSCTQDSEKIRLRFRTTGFQTMGKPVTAAPWGWFAIARPTKPIALEENDQRFLGQPPVWVERRRLAP